MELGKRSLAWLNIWPSSLKGERRAVGRREKRSQDFREREALQKEEGIVSAHGRIRKVSRRSQERDMRTFSRQQRIERGLSVTKTLNSKGKERKTGITIAITRFAIKIHKRGKRDLVVQWEKAE